MNWGFSDRAPLELLTIDAQFIELDAVSDCLAQINRHNGRTQRPISEAEHAVHTVAVLEKDYGITDPCALLAALLFNAHKLFTGSPSDTVRVFMGAGWDMLEAGTRAVVMKRFGVWTAYTTHQVCILGASQFVQATECAQLMPHGRRDHGLLIQQRPPPPWLDLVKTAHSAPEWREIHRAQVRLLMGAIANGQARQVTHHTRHSLQEA